MAQTAQSSQVIRFGAVEVDLRAGELRKHGIRIKLQEQPFRVLAMLLERPGEVVTREELRAKLWPADTFVDFDHGLNSAINKLREALGDSADNPRYIETLPRRGYRFLAPLHAQPQSAIPANATATVPSGPIAPSGPSAAEGVWHSHGRAIVAAAAGLVMLAAGIYVADVAHVREKMAGKTAAARIQSIAVLPLDNLSHDPDQEYFADGMTDELIAQLAKIRALRVISRTSVMRYKHVSKPLPQIAKELGVDAILEGAVLRSGNQVRITAELVDARTDRHVWAEDYARDLSDILGLQGDVAKDVAREVQVQLSPEEKANLASGFTSNPEAFDLYLRSLREAQKRTVAGWQAGLAYAQAAAEKDPGFAKAYTGIADAYFQLAGRVMPPREAMPKVKQAAATALAIDERLSEAHTSYASVLFYYDWNWDGAEREFRRALELNPGYAYVHSVYADFLAATGRTEEALSERRRAAELQPGPRSDCGGLRGLLYARRFDQGVGILDQMREQDPKLQIPCVWAGELYETKGRYDDAIRLYEQAIALSPQDTLPVAASGRAYALSGNKERAQRVLRQLFDLSRKRFVSPFDVAVLYTGLGQKDEALRWLEKAVSERSGLLVYLKVDPMFDSVRSDPRFAAIMEKVHIPQ